MNVGLIVSPISGLSGRVGLIVPVSEDKPARLAQPILWVDSGALEFDAKLARFVRVRTKRGRETMMRLSAGEIAMCVM